ncbi:MAG: CoA transferase, partial [Gemmatimonadota bacterium]
IGFAWAGTWVVYQSLYGDLPERMGDRIATYAPNGAYETEDALVYVSAFGDTSWRKLCHALDREELIEDDRFATPAARCAHRDELDDIIEARTREFDAETLQSTLLSANVPCAPIQSPAEAMADAHLRERGMVGTVETEEGETVAHAGNPVRLGGASAIEHPRVPDRGEHTDVVLADELGYDEARIRELEETGAVGPARD